MLTLNGVTGTWHKTTPSFSSCKIILKRVLRKNERKRREEKARGLKRERERKRRGKNDTLYWSSTSVTLIHLSAVLDLSKKMV